MSESYERERQNNARLDELSAKVSALRGVTIDIYDNARAHEVIDSTVSLYPTPIRAASCAPSSLPKMETSTTEEGGPTKLVSILLTLPATDRHVFFHGHAAQGIRRPSGTHGGVGEQGSDPEAGGAHRWADYSSLLHLEAVLLESGDLSTTAITRWVISRYGSPDETSTLS